MRSPSRFTIDFNETFPNLERAPSIEAVIHWQAHASRPLNQETLREELLQRFPDYPMCQPQRGIEIEASETPDGTSQVFHRTHWDGFRLKDEHNRHVAQFTRMGVVFSRLEPYEKWESFQAEAIRFWNIFLELAAPTAIQRLGVRYINRIPLSNNEQPSDYLKIVPPPLSELNFFAESFFYEDTYQVPGYPYRINWVRTLQPQQPSLSDVQALILDIDVSTTAFFDLERETLVQKLAEMRWLKNKVFFSCITQTALEQFGA